LDELVNQSELTCDLTANTRNEKPWESLLGLRRLALKSDIAIYKEGMSWSQNYKDKLFKVRIGLAEPMRGGITIRCL
jgi:hypothetical protein